MPASGSHGSSVLPLAALYFVLMTTRESIFKGPLFGAEREAAMKRQATYERARRAAGAALHALHAERDRSALPNGDQNGKQRRKNSSS
jgi:hypothetical protein